MTHYDFSDFGTGDFFIFSAEDIAFNSVNHRLQLITGNGAFISGTADTDDQLITIVLFTIQVLLNYYQWNSLHVLISGKSFSAGIA